MEDQAAIKETAEWLNRLGYPELTVRLDNDPAMLAFRDAVIRKQKEHFGVRVIAHAPRTYDPASAGMVENVTKLVKEKVRTLVIATRKLHGVVMDPVHVALAWYVHFCWSNQSPYRERCRWAHCIPTCISACASPTSHACMVRKDLVLGSEQEEGSCRGNGDGHEHGCLDALTIPLWVRRRPHSSRSGVSSLSRLRHSSLYMAGNEFSEFLMKFLTKRRPATYVTIQAVLSQYVSRRKTCFVWFLRRCVAHKAHFKSYALSRTVLP